MGSELCQKALVLWDTGPRKHLSCSGNTAWKPPSSHWIEQEGECLAFVHESYKQVLLQVRFDLADESLSRSVLSCHTLSPALSTAPSPPFTNVSASGITSLASVHGHRLLARAGYRLGTISVRPRCCMWVRPTQKPRASTEESPSLRTRGRYFGKELKRAVWGTRASAHVSPGCPVLLLGGLCTPPSGSLLHPDFCGGQAEAS